MPLTPFAILLSSLWKLAPKSDSERSLLSNSTGIYEMNKFQGVWKIFLRPKGNFQKQGKVLKAIARQKENFQNAEKVKGRRKMKACENHNESVVVFNGDSCPLCKAERKLKNIWAELEKSMAIMKQIQKTAEEVGLKIA